MSGQQDNAEAEEFVESKAPPALPVQKPRLRAATAMGAFFLFMAAQIVVTLVVTIIVAVIFIMSGGGLDNPKGLTAEIQRMMPMIVLVSFAGGAIGLVFAAMIVRPSLKDTSPFGAAWIMGTPKKIFFCIGLGVAVALVYLVVPLFLIVPDENLEGGPLSQMFTEPGWGRIAVIILAIFLAPPIEELLFRGILLGGLNRSFGLKWGVGISIFIFVIIHFGEAMHYLPSFLGIGLMACSATWVRLSSGSIGPAIGVHFGYNSVVVGVGLLSL